MNKSECVDRILSILDNLDVHLVTVSPESFTVRGWNGLFDYFSDCFGGHFDSNEHLIANVCLDDENNLNAALATAVAKSKRQFVRFSAEPSYGIQGSCCMLVPCRVSDR